MTESHVLRARSAEGAQTVLGSPSVGVFEPCVLRGEVVTGGQEVGALDVLGVRHVLRAPAGITGQVEGVAGEGRSRVPVQYDEALLTLSVGVEVGGAADALQQSAAKEIELAFVAPMSGRFYSRPSPQDPVFVASGDTIVAGQTVGLLEVMKTFNRLVYQGEGMPEAAVVEAIVPADGDDVVRGDVLLSLKPVKKGS